MLVNKKQGKLFTVHVLLFYYEKKIWKRNKQTKKEFFPTKVSVKYHSNISFHSAFIPPISKAVLSPSPAALLESPFSVAGATSVELPPIPLVDQQHGFPRAVSSFEGS